MENPLGREVLHIQVAAALAVIVLIGAGTWQVVHLLGIGAPKTPSTASSDQTGAQNASTSLVNTADATNTDPITAVSNEAVGELVGAYAGLQQEGIYSSTTGAKIAGSIGLGLQAPITYTQIDASDVHTSTDTSYQAMMNYRSELQTSLKPLMKNSGPEYALIGMYVQTKQQTYLDQLAAAAANYSAAASSTLALTAPADAVQVQIGLVNSLNEFAATLNAYVVHANDPIASTILLENYNQAENDVLNAFQALVTYEQSKTK